MRRMLITILMFPMVFFADIGVSADDKPVPASPGAVPLFDGKDLSGWSTRNGKPVAWTVQDGYMECKPGSGDIMTKEKHGGDFQLHVEFWLPLMADKRGQARSNSGVYVQGRYEIQVLDSFGLTKLGKGDCGALYGQYAPQVNGCKPPETWQTFDITFRAPKVDSAGKVTEKGRITVVQNGKTVLDNVEIQGVCGGNLDDKVGEPGPLLLQDHGNKIRFRNIWVKPLATGAS